MTGVLSQKHVISVRNHVTGRSGRGRRTCVVYVIVALTAHFAGSRIKTAVGLYRLICCSSLTIYLGSGHNSPGHFPSWTMFPQFLRYVGHLQHHPPINNIK